MKMEGPSDRENESKREHNLRDKMPVNVAMHDPRASVIGTEADGDVVGSG